MADDSDWGLVKDGGTFGVSWFSRTKKNGDTELKAWQSDASLKYELERNKEFQNSGKTGYTESKDVKHVAYIPPMFFTIWQQRYGVNLYDPANVDALNKILNDPEWRDIRTGGGRI